MIRQLGRLSCSETDLKTFKTASPSSENGSTQLTFDGSVIGSVHLDDVVAGVLRDDVRQRRLAQTWSSVKKSNSLLGTSVFVQLLDDFGVSLTYKKTAWFVLIAGLGVPSLPLALAVRENET